MNIAELTIGDIEAAAALEQACCSELPWDETALFTYLMRDDTLLLKAGDGERLVGLAGLLMAPPDSDILDITVAPEYRRRGIGAALLKELFERAAERGVSTVYLEVRAGNEGAKALYRKTGFREIGLRRNYYTDPKEDAVVMERKSEPDTDKETDINA